ncbi:MAG TPA: hypothetical protein VK961_09955 [Chthoniobacter sp.]|nr:hypothetical protein [Chthoniobacter sp.]
MSIGNSGEVSSAAEAALDLDVAFFVVLGFATFVAVVARVFVGVVRFLAGFLVVALCSSSKGCSAGSVIGKVFKSEN